MQDGYLRFVGIHNHATAKILRRARDVRDTVTNQAARAGFGESEGQPAFAQEFANMFFGKGFNHEPLRQNNKVVPLYRRRARSRL